MNMEKIYFGFYLEVYFRNRLYFSLIMKWVFVNISFLFFNNEWLF